MQLPDTSEKPALHLQSLAAVFATPIVAAPVGHDVHPDCPGLALYFPAEQSEQVPTVVAPTAAEYLPAAQLEQVSTVVAPTAAEYLPAAQLEQVPTVVAPTAAEYLP